MKKLIGRKLIAAVTADVLLNKLSLGERELVRRVAERYGKYVSLAGRTSTENRKRGLCIRCGLVKVKRSGHCKSCRELTTAERKKRNAARMKAGLCVRCKEEKDNKELTMCADCRKKYHDYEVQHSRRIR